MEDNKEVKEIVSIENFFKKNKQEYKEAEYPATESLKGKDGKPLMWKFRSITSEKDDELKAESQIEEKYKINGVVQKRKVLDLPTYMKKLVCESCIFPNLNDAKLQDSYGVMSAEQLIMKMVDSPGEYQDLHVFVQKLNGFKTIIEDIEEAKN